MVRPFGFNLPASIGAQVMWKWVGAQEKHILKNALAAAAELQPNAEPLDWMETMSPRRWRFGGKIASYDWFDGEGANPYSS
jgi:alpha-galactosidase